MGDGHLQSVLWRKCPRHTTKLGMNAPDFKVSNKPYDGSDRQNLPGLIVSNQPHDGRDRQNFSGLIC